MRSHRGLYFIWIRFDNGKLGEKNSLPLLLEDPLISEFCALEESASHHVHETPKIHQKSLKKTMFLKMNQDTLGDLLNHQKSLEKEASHHVHLDACEIKNPHETTEIH